MAEKAGMTPDTATVEGLANAMGDTVGEQVETVSAWVDALIEFGVTYGFQIFGALVFLFIGLKVAGFGGRRLTALLESKNVDQTLARFIGNVAKIVGVVFLVIITLGNFGISIAPLIALAGASAFGATIAIQGPLSNYGAGLSIILARPFSVGNTITINRDTSGVVEDITLANTVLVGEDGEQITIPNKEIVGRVIVNSDTNRVVQTRICIGDGEDWEEALVIARRAVGEFAEIKDGPRAQVGVHDFTYGGIVMGVRFWVPSKRYFETRYRVNEAILKGLREAGIKLMPAGGLAVAAGSLSADEEEEEHSVL